jgi:hypothetical protein
VPPGAALGSDGPARHGIAGSDRSHGDMRYDHRVGSEGPVPISRSVIETVAPDGRMVLKLSHMIAAVG